MGSFLARMTLAALVATFFMAGCGNVRSDESDWRAGQIMAAAFLCSAVDPIVRYAKAEPAGVEKILGVFFAAGVCSPVPEGMGVYLEEHILTFSGIDAAGATATFEIWRIQAEADVFIGVFSRTEAERRGLIEGKEI